MNKRQIDYNLIGSDNLPHVIFTIKWHKGSLYLADVGHVPNFSPKISYHAPRNGLSQVHMKISDKLMPTTKHFSCPLQDVKGVRPLGGSGIPIYLIPTMPKLKERKESRVYDARPYLKSQLSSIQWYHFLVEPNKENLFWEHPMIKKNNSEFSERLLISVLKDCRPWIFTEFIRIREENPVWHKPNLEGWLRDFCRKY